MYLNELRDMILALHEAHGNLREVRRVYHRLCLSETAPTAMQYAGTTNVCKRQASFIKNAADGLQPQPMLWIP